MQTGKIKVVLLIDGQWAYTTPIIEAKLCITQAAWDAIVPEFKRLDFKKPECPVKAVAYPEQHDEP